ncbi:MAG: gamma-glutamyltransferase [Gammaproteobacteria bacterium]|nr:gamma-glutamyltransferase [Gammaproteobacteria bacterium]
MTRMHRLAVLFCLLALIACEQAPPDSVARVPEPATPAAATAIDLSPEAWDPDVLAAYRAAIADQSVTSRFSGQSLVDGLAAAGAPLHTTGETGLVASTSSPFAVHAGLETLKRGGHAIDAALTVALTQVADHLGGATSYAGQLSLIHYEAATGIAHRLNAGYATVLGEGDPMSIPGYGTPSGRAVMVPGFMAGIEAASERFGRVPFGELFAPAIHLAEEGVPLSGARAAMMRQREHVLTRLESGRELFLDAEGKLPDAGDLFRQPRLAEFLRKVRREGAAYMYEGDWANRFVQAVQAEGGHMALADLARYEAVWDELPPARVRGVDVYGSPNLVEKLRLAELADLRSRGHYSQSADALYWLMHIARVNSAIGPHLVGGGLPREEAEALLPSLDLSEEGRYAPEMTGRLWAAMQTPEWDEVQARSEAEQVRQAEIIANLIRDFAVREPEEEANENEDVARPDHTAGIAVIDTEGNVTSLVHSVTSAVWGELGVFVDGVSVVDPGAFAQASIEATGPGRILGVYGGSGIPSCPAIALRDGEPLLACGNVGASFDVVAQQGLVNMIEYGMSPEEAGAQPMFYKQWPPGQPVRQLVGGEGNFTAALLAEVRARGIDIEATTDPAQVTSGGIWVVGARDPETGVLGGAVTAGMHTGGAGDFAGLVEAY